MNEELLAASVLFVQSGHICQQYLNPSDETVTLMKCKEDPNPSKMQTIYSENLQMKKECLCLKSSIQDLQTTKKDHLQRKFPATKMD
jgi:hypothetical protein